MPGLIEQAQAGPPGQEVPVPEAGPPGLAAPAEQAPEEGLEEMTPEEEEAYTAGMNMAAELLYNNDEASEGIQTTLAKSDKLQAIADVVTFVISQVEDAFQGQLPETVIVPLADEISDLTMELGMESGAFELSDDDIIQAKGVVMNSLFEDYGVEEEDLEGMLQGVTGDEIAELQQAFSGGA